MSNVLDTPPSTDPSSVSYMQTVLRYGVIGAMITIIFGLIGNLTGLSSPCNGIAMTAIFGLVSIVIYIGVLVYGIRKHQRCGQWVQASRLSFGLWYPETPG